MNKLFILTTVFLVVMFLAISQANAQLREEKLEERLNRLVRETIYQKKQAATVKAQRINSLKNKKNKKLRSSIELSAGHNSNPQSSTTRKGDIFEKVLYTLSVKTPLSRNWNFTGSYNVDVLQYNELTDLSNVLNHTRLGLERQLGPRFVMGFGYDGSWLYYRSNKSSDYLNHKGYLFLKHYISKRSYQQVTLERGYKHYIEADTLGEVSGTLDDKKRVDNRQSVEYVYMVGLTDRITLKLRGKYSVNDSNAKFQDFYDFTAYDFTPRLIVKLTKRLIATGSVGYTRRVYKNRLIAAGIYKERDNDYVTRLGVSYALNDANTIDSSYTYRQSYSNDSTAAYSGSLMSVGFRHNF